MKFIKLILMRIVVYFYFFMCFDFGYFYDEEEHEVDRLCVKAQVASTIYIMSPLCTSVTSGKALEPATYFWTRLPRVSTCQVIA